ncbi:MAG TPA: hypothetical protein VKG78_02670 [Opitutaceae bacterium]|nr:hypothetical protein [Opitutaceae bacterium]
MNLRLVFLNLALVLSGSASAQSFVFDVQGIGGSFPPYVEFTPADGGDGIGLSLSPESVAGTGFSLSGSNIQDVASFTGTISGTFTISGIANASPVGRGAVSSMNGTLTVSDGMGDTETAHLWWKNVLTLFQGGGLNSVGINAGPAENLSSFTYAGTPNTALQRDFADINGGATMISFSYLSDPSSLTELASAPSSTTETSTGHVSDIPEPSTYAAICGAMALVLGVARRLSSA